MQRLHLKLFYLRTRHKREPQGATAKTLGVRPATMSHLEQGRSLPTLPMLLSLCKHYDVTPTYLLDDDRPIEPENRDRLSEAGGAIAPGDWLEVPDGAAVRSTDGVWLCPVMKGARAYDSKAQAQRLVCGNAGDADALLRSIVEQRRNADHDLGEQLQRELLGQRKPRRKDAAAGNGVVPSTPPSPAPRELGAEG